MNRSERSRPTRPGDAALASVLELARTVLRWPVESQLGSRRNALLASTRLTEASRQRRDVDDFLDGLGRLDGAAEDAGQRDVM